MSAIQVTRFLGLVAAALLLASTPRVDAGDWVIARSPGFLVVSDAGEKRARMVAHQFEQIRALFGQVFKARVDPGRLVVVYACKDERGMGKLLGHNRRDLPAGRFMPGIDKHVIVLRLDAGGPSPYRVMYHEYVHLLVRLNFRWLPLWLNEGLAEFYATADIDETEVRWGQVWGQHVGALRQSTRIPLDQLTSARQYASGSIARRWFYSESALLTHFLLLGDPARRGQLGRFVELLGKDVADAEALSRAFGDLKVLESALAAYAHRSSFRMVKAQVRLDAPTIQTVSLGPEEADVLRADFMARRGGRREARALLESVLTRAPGQGLAHEVLGIIESVEGRRSEALRHLTEAARLASTSYVAPFRLGMLKVPGDTSDRERRALALRSAIQRNAAFAPAYAALSRLLMEGEPTEEAALLAARAAALEPGAGGYRVLLWHALERLGRKEEASRVESQLRRAALADVETLAEMVRQFEDVGRAAEAEALLRSARATNEASAFLLGRFLAAHARWDEAVTLAREELAREPKSTTALNNLAFTLAERGSGLDEALSLAERALKESPKSSVYLDTKGFILLRMKRPAEAESILRAAVAEHPDPEILDHLGDALLELGKRKESLEAYERALQTAHIEERLREAIQAKVAKIGEQGDR